MRIKLRILIGLVMGCFLMLQDLAAQKKVVGLPEAFKEPLDLGIGVIPDTKAKDRQIPWLVVSDRDDNKVYKEPNEDSEVARTLKFRDAFYVLDENEDWIKLIDVDVFGSLKLPDGKPGTVIGWIPKKNMLLWTSGLLNRYTRINQKVCLLNRADHADEINDHLQKVDLYYGPTAKASGQEIQIYNFYFVLKKEGDRYLLCEEDVFNRRYLDKIVGWVKQTRCAEWNTRIALEPNFDQAAFEERRLTPAFQLHGYADRDPALRYGQTGDPQTGPILWNQDPVRLNQNDKQLARADFRRYIGQRLRFPVLAPEQSNLKLEVFRTGVLGSVQVRREGSDIKYAIPEDVWAQVKKYRDKVEKTTQNINVCFLIEGSTGVAGYKDRINAAIQSISDEYKGKVNNLRFAAVVYRGPHEKDVPINGRKMDKRLEYIPLTPNAEQVVSWIGSQEFASWNDNLDYKALYYGIAKGLEKVDFDNEATNIMMVVGNFGDYRADPILNEALLKDETRVKAADVVSALSKFKVHLYALQCINNQREESTWFGRHLRYLILESARNGYVNSFGNKTDPEAAKIRELLKQSNEPPLMADDDKALRVELAKGYLWPGWLIRAKGTQPPAEVQNYLLSFFKESFDRIANINEQLKKSIDEGSSLIGSDDFTPDMAAFLYDMAKIGRVPFQYVTSLTGQKYQIFKEEYFPQQVANAQYPMFSYVLFMPQTDLNRYQQIIHNCINVDKPVPQMREDLETIYRQLIIQFTGNEQMLDNFKKMTVSEVSAIVQGVYGEGLKISMPVDVIIGDLKNERKTPDSVIKQLSNRFEAVDKKITEVLRRDNYEFMYDSGFRKYYWMPVEDMF